MRFCLAAQVSSELSVAVSVKYGDVCMSLVQSGSHHSGLLLHASSADEEQLGHVLVQEWCELIEPW